MAHNINTYIGRQAAWHKLRAKRDDAARLAAFNQRMLEAEESEPYESYGFNSQEEMDAEEHPDQVEATGRSF